MYIIMVNWYYGMLAYLIIHLIIIFYKFYISMQINKNYYKIPDIFKQI